MLWSVCAGKRPHPSRSYDPPAQHLPAKLETTDVENHYFSMADAQESISRRSRIAIDRATNLIIAGDPDANTGHLIAFVAFIANLFSSRSIRPQGQGSAHSHRPRRRRRRHRFINGHLTIIIILSDLGFSCNTRLLFAQTTLAYMNIKFFKTN